MHCSWLTGQGRTCQGERLADWRTAQHTVCKSDHDMYHLVRPESMIVLVDIVGNCVDIESTHDLSLRQALCQSVLHPCQTV